VVGWGNLAEEELRALILGSGFAGQCHAEALRYCGVAIEGMASRTEPVVRDVAARMGIPYASADWQQAIEDLQPDVIAVGTPGGVHLNMWAPAWR